MKKLCSVIVSCVLAMGLLAACGGGQSSSPSQVRLSYPEIIEASRPAELNEIDLYNVVTSADDPRYDGIFSDAYGFVAEDMDEYAISISMIITQAYGVAIIKPAAGKTDAVLDQVNNFVTAMQKSCENYLQDQYAIAKAAIVKTAPTGEVLLAMCEDAETVMQNMENYLKV